MTICQIKQSYTKNEHFIQQWRFMLLTVGVFVVSYLKKTKNQIRKKLMKNSKKKINSFIQERWGGPAFQL